VGRRLARGTADDHFLPQEAHPTAGSATPEGLTRGLARPQLDARPLLTQGLRGPVDRQNIAAIYDAMVAYHEQGDLDAAGVAFLALVEQGAAAAPLAVRPELTPIYEEVRGHWHRLAIFEQLGLASWDPALPKMDLPGTPDWWQGPQAQGERSPVSSRHLADKPPSFACPRDGCERRYTGVGFLRRHYTQKHIVGPARPIPAASPPGSRDLARPVTTPAHGPGGRGLPPYA
jgi:hypothetical protein